MRKPTAKPLSDLLPAVLAPSLQRHGLATSQLITRWRDIAGEELSAVTRVLRINWPRQRNDNGVMQNARSGATLVLQVESAYALDAQHAAPQILERVNALYGWPAIAKLSLRQGPVMQDRMPEVKTRRPGDSSGTVAGIKDDDLRAALARLKANIS